MIRSTKNRQTIRLGHSPDPDDAFMFYGLACGAVDSGPFEFEHTLADIQTLNDWAQNGKLEITAASVHAYPYLQDRYAILSSGVSMGATELANYVPDAGVTTPPLPKTRATGVHGPLVVCRRPIAAEELSDLIIAVPGTLTTAFLSLKLAVGDFQYRVLPFDHILDAVENGQADAGLIIHEGQLTYAQHGLHKALDLGRWWFERKKLPLPLGCNLIRRDLGLDTMRRISKILKSSIEYGLTHRNEAIGHAMGFGRGIDAQQADDFVGMYVNPWTLDYGPAGREAVAELLAEGRRAGLVPAMKKLEFI
jgi:1,4-dihydroxy-6-naphthoate synthase